MYMLLDQDLAEYSDKVLQIHISSLNKQLEAAQIAMALLVCELNPRLKVH